MQLLQRLNGQTSNILKNEVCLFCESRRYFPRMQNKKRRTRRQPLPFWSPRIKHYMKLKIRDQAKRQQPVQPVRLEPDRPRIDNDPDPFAYQLHPQNLYPSYKFDEWPLYPGIRPDQFRYGMCWMKVKFPSNSTQFMDDIDILY